MFDTSYIIANDKQFADALNKAAERVSNLRVAFKRIQDDWIKANKAQFSLKGSGQYPPLSPAYAAWKQKTHPGKPILVLSGRLRDSMTTRSGTADSIRQVGKLAMILGTRVPYGIYHQADGARGRLPQRKFLFIGPEGRDNGDGTRGKLQRWLAILEAEVQRQLRK